MPHPRPSCPPEQLAIYNTGLIASRFYQVLGTRPVQGLKELLVTSIVVIVAVALCLSLASFVQGHLTVMWRKHLTVAMHKEYCNGFRCYYVNNFLGKTVDNPLVFVLARVTVGANAAPALVGSLRRGLAITPSP